MGIQDLNKLFEIHREIKKIDKENKFNFVIDTDTKEGRTRIVIDEFGTWKKTPYSSSLFWINLEVSYS